MIINLGWGADLLDHAAFHHHNLGRQCHRLNLVMGYIDHRCAKALMQCLNLSAHFHPQLGVKVGQRLVEQEQLWITHKGAAHRNTLTLTAGQLSRLAVQQGLNL